MTISEIKFGYQDKLFLLTVRDINYKYFIIGEFIQ